ncbi:YchJ family protein [Legionella worsleiensis]|uniref:Putative SEC-C motif domain protein n=1 Tax=Legionella worsleiensis TaxID=45076 RepID=A0A0W1A620_9GAMM|nr:YchJ family protein [Legionella worsleiensis]KTD76801.1 putative SEC-C motif domain protein [Legionella worsleiensis]STY30643.1 putative SEC-C motif domain protein [Legionella worsleiensis]
MSLCPCGSQTLYCACCGIYIDGNHVPQTPEQLMRSRYTAYSLANIDYIKHTMKGKPLTHFDADAAKTWAQQVTFVRLNVLHSSLETPHKGFVEFQAVLIERNKLKTIHELSEFNQEDKIWFYVDGISKNSDNFRSNKTIPMNSPCPCGSGKKFKNCHGK